MNRTMNPDLFQDNSRRFIRECKKLVKGNDEVFDLAIMALTTDGHLLLESVPGLGKTVFGMSLGAALKGGKWKFFQFSSDLLPSDIKGSEIFDEELRKMKLHYGALHPENNFTLADELNRGVPKTVSSMLSAMEEKQITVGQHVMMLADPSLIIATQNPIEQEGTFELPEATLDRFSVKGRLGYLGRQDEFDLLRNPAIYKRDPQKHANIEPVLTPQDIIDMRDFVTDEVRVSDHVLNYMLNLIRATRSGKCQEAHDWLAKEHKGKVLVGASQRTSKWLYITSKAAAAMRGSMDVTPQDVKRVFIACVAHKLVLSQECKATMNADETAVGIAQQLLDKVPTNE